MKYVVGMLMLGLFSAHAYGEDKKAVEPKKAEVVPIESRQPANVSEKQQVDELEKVMQSTYDYNNTMMELGDASGR